MSTGTKGNNKERPKKLYERPVFCKVCDKSMTYMYGDIYKCMSCGYEELSDFGKVKMFLEKNGSQTAIAISQATGVSVDYVNELLKEGRIEIPDGSNMYIKCQNCGTDIRYGRYCPDCMVKMTNNISTALWNAEVGEKPKSATKKQTGVMHILHKNKE